MAYSDNKIPANIYLFKVNNRNSLFKVFGQLWTYFTPFSDISIVDFEQINVSWDSNCVMVYFAKSGHFLIILKKFVSGKFPIGLSYLLNTLKSDFTPSAKNFRFDLSHFFIYRFPTIFVAALRKLNIKHGLEVFDTLRTYTDFRFISSF